MSDASETYRVYDAGSSSKLVHPELAFSDDDAAEMLAKGNCTLIDLLPEGRSSFVSNIWLGGLSVSHFDNKAEANKLCAFIGGMAYASGMLDDYEYIVERRSAVPYKGTATPILFDEHCFALHPLVKRININVASQRYGKGVEPTIMYLSEQVVLDATDFKTIPDYDALARFALADHRDNYLGMIRQCFGAVLSKIGVEAESSLYAKTSCAYIADAFEPLFSGEEREALAALDEEPPDTAQNLARRMVSRTLGKEQLALLCGDMFYMEALEKLYAIATYWIHKLQQGIEDMSEDEQDQLALVLMELEDLSDQLAVAVKWTGLDYAIDAAVRGVPLSML